MGNPWLGCLFDLDGTLLDTIADLADTMNRVLENHHWLPFAVHEYLEKVGDGIEMLVKRSIPSGLITDVDLTKAIVSEFVQYYEQHWHVKTVPYPGIVPMLEKLQERNLKLSVLSNKMDDFTQLCVRHFFPTVSFDWIQGSLPGVPKKPDPDSALQIAGHLGLTPGQMLYIGDTPIDMKTAHNAGMKPIGVSWGFRSADQLAENGADLILVNPEALLLLF